MQLKPSLAFSIIDYRYFDTLGNMLVVISITLNPSAAKYSPQVSHRKFTQKEKFHYSKCTVEMYTSHHITQNPMHMPTGSDVSACATIIIIHADNGLGTPIALISGKICKSCHRYKKPYALSHYF